MNILIIFTLANVVNVIIQTVKSIATIKCGKVGASIINAIAYGFYTYIVILMSADLPLIGKCLIVGMCNLFGVYIVKFFEEKMRKDKLWKIEGTINNKYSNTVDKALCEQGIPHNYIENVGSWVIYNCYCSTKEQTVIAKNILDGARAKYFVSETKIL